MKWHDVSEYLLIGLAIIVVILLVVFWIKMLIHAVTEPNASDRLMWGLIVFFGGLIGAIIYAVVHRSRRAVDELYSGKHDEQMLREMREEWRRK